MELSKQIKKYRMKENLSQDELADKLYVSRQTISNWENDKSYPDVKSLLLISEVFQISLDQLVKGDIEEMKQTIEEKEIIEFQKNSNIFTILFIAMLVFPLPLIKVFKVLGIVLSLLLFVLTMYYAVKIEKYKKKHDIQTYKEIIAFTEGKKLDEIDKAREEGKRTYQKVLLVGTTMLVTVIIALIYISIF